MMIDLREPTTYFRFSPPHRPEEYVGQPGPHFGLALPPFAYDAIAEAKVTRRANQYAVVGEWRRGNVHYLDLAVTTAWIEDNTNYRPDDRGHLRWICPECGRSRHTKLCSLA